MDCQLWFFFQAAWFWYILQKGTDEKAQMIARFIYLCMLKAHCRHTDWENKIILKKRIGQAWIISVAREIKAWKRSNSFYLGMELICDANA